MQYAHALCPTDNMHTRGIPHNFTDNSHTSTQKCALSFTVLHSTCTHPVSNTIAVSQAKGNRKKKKNEKRKENFIGIAWYMKGKERKGSKIKRR